MVSQAIALAIMTFIGLYFLFQKLPKTVQDFFIKHQLLTDVLTTIGTYYLLGGTLTALFAGAIVDLFILGTFYVHIHRDSFQYLWDIKELIKEKMQEVHQLLQKYGQSYKEMKENKKNERVNEDSVSTQVSSAC